MAIFIIVISGYWKELLSELLKLKLFTQTMKLRLQNKNDFCLNICRILLGWWDMQPISWRLKNSPNNFNTTKTVHIFLFFLNTHIIGHYNPSFQITDQLLKPLMLFALILYVSGGTYSLKSTLNDRFLRNCFTAIFIYSQILCQKSGEENCQRNAFFVFMPDLGYESELYIL